MIKRLTWFISGAAAGIAGAGYTKRKVKQTASQLAPTNVAKRAASGVRTRLGNFRDAAREGRSAMRSKETELRARRDGRITNLADQLDPNDEVLVDGRPVEPGQVFVLHQYRDDPQRSGQNKPKNRRGRRGA